MVITPSDNPIMSSKQNPNPITGGTFGAFRPPEAKKRQTRLYILLGIFLALAAATVYYLFFMAGITSFQVTSNVSLAQELNTTELKVSRLPSFNFDLTDSVLYKSLKLHGVIPIKIEALGRVNPFAPF